jgi:hypothetical protein
LAKKAFVYDGSQWVDIAQSTTDLSNYANLTTTPISGFRNAIINGGMDVWQRGTSSTSTSAAYLTADRWATWIDSGSGTVAQDTTNVPIGLRYGLKYTSGGASGSCVFYHTIETANSVKLAGKYVTLSAYLTGTTGKSVQMSLWYSTTTDNAFTGSWTLVDASGFSATGTSTRITLANKLIPSSAKTIQVRFYNLDKLTNTQFTSVTGVQLEEGSIATPFEQRPIGTELALCQRYYQRINYNKLTAYSIFGFGAAESTTSARVFYKLNEMRVLPSSVDFSSGLVVVDLVNSYNLTGLSIDGGRASSSFMSLTATVASGLTQFRPYELRANNDINAFVGFSAEL